VINASDPLGVILNYRGGSYEPGVFTSLAS
jgi:hypothetical protein